MVLCLAYIFNNLNIYFKNLELLSPAITRKHQ